MTSSCAPVARAFFVIHVVHDDVGAPTPRLCLRATYGLGGGAGTGEDEDLVAVASGKHFCFPEFTFAPGSITSIVPSTERVRPEQYTFSLTEGDGTRTVGFCRRFLPPSDGGRARYPVVMCVLSKHAWFSFFFTALEKVEPHILALPPLSTSSGGSDDGRTTTGMPSGAHATQFLRAVCARPAAGPGAELVIPLPWHVPVRPSPPPTRPAL
jgi:hypothetical protein